MDISKIIFPSLSYTGWGAINKLLPEVEKFNPERILLITDKVLKELGLTEQITSLLEENRYEVKIYTDIDPEPSLLCGQKLVDYTRKYAFDLIIGFGGGSVLDMAKLTAIISTHEGEVAEYLNLTGAKAIKDKGLPKILIPTTSGTGSEVTNIAVLSLDSTKDVVTDNALLADVAIIDPELTVSVPPKVTAATGVDAFTHAIEAYLSTQSSETSDALSLQAIRKIGSSIKTAVFNGSDRQARTDMSMGSYMAGLAFFNAGVAGVHALAYPLGGQFHIAHGESNALLLPYVMGYIRPKCEERMAFLYELLTGDQSLTQREGSEAFIYYLRDLIEAIQIPQTLRDFNIQESAIESLTNDAVKQERLLARSPMELKKQDIYRIYKAAYDGQVQIN